MPKELHEEYNFRLYIYRVLKQVHPDTGITQEAMNEVNLILHYLLESLMDNVNRLVNHEKKITVTSRAVQSAVRLTLPGELAKHAVSEGTKAVKKYNASIVYAMDTKATLPKGTKAHKSSQSHKASLTFPVSRIGHLMRFYMQHCDRLGKAGPVYLAATLEYICAEILELAGNAAKDNKRIRIRTRDLTLGIENDEELHKLFKDVTLSGGVIPHI